MRRTRFTCSIHQGKVETMVTLIRAASVLAAAAGLAGCSSLEDTGLFHARLSTLERAVPETTTDDTADSNVQAGAEALL